MFFKLHTCGLLLGNGKCKRILKQAGLVQSKLNLSTIVFWHVCRLQIHVSAQSVDSMLTKQLENENECELCVRLQVPDVVSSGGRSPPWDSRAQVDLSEAGPKNVRVATTV